MIKRTLIALAVVTSLGVAGLATTESAEAGGCRRGGGGGWGGYVPYQASYGYGGYGYGGHGFHRGHGHARAVTSFYPSSYYVAPAPRRSGFLPVGRILIVSGTH